MAEQLKLERATQNLNFEKYTSIYKSVATCLEQLLSITQFKKKPDIFCIRVYQIKCFVESVLCADTAGFCVDFITNAVWEPTNYNLINSKTQVCKRAKSSLWEQQITRLSYLGLFKHVKQKRTMPHKTKNTLK